METPLSQLQNHVRKGYTALYRPTHEEMMEMLEKEVNIPLMSDPCAIFGGATEVLMAFYLPVR